jgi:autotransporter-associated beta strand protein
MATRTWSGLGGDNNWTTAGNWDVLPVAGDDLVFAGVVRLTPVNDFAAATSFNSITFSNTAGAFVITGAQITLAGNVTNNDVDLQTINFDIVIAVVRTFNAASGSLAFGGIISGAGGLIKSGSFVVTLSGVNTYTSTTTVTAGTLLVNGTLNVSSLVTVNGTGILGGTGTINGAITLVSGGTIAPGAASGISIGTLNTANVTGVAGSIYSVDLNGTTPTFDQINSTGTVTCGSATLTVADIINAAANKVYTIISAVSVTGTFNGLSNGSTFLQLGRTFQIVYTATTVTLRDVTAVATSTKIWDGGGADNNWTTPNNWVGDIPPIAGDAIQFDGAVRLTPNNDFVADTIFNGITFNVGASAFVIGGNRITTTGSLVNNGVNLQTISLDIVNSEWTPTQIESIGWYDASDTSTLTSALGKVSQWNDKSGNNKDVTQATGSRQPTTGVRTINGVNVLDFVGLSDQYLGTVVMDVPSSGDSSWFAVAKPDSSDQTACSMFSIDGGDDFQLVSDTASTNFNAEVRSAGSVIGTHTAVGFPFNGPSIYNVVFDWGSSVGSTWVDGTDVSGAPAAYNVNKVGQVAGFINLTFRIMANRGTANAGLDGGLGEFLLIEDVTTDTRQRVEGYLAWKWGLEANLPGGHPYASSPPNAALTIDAASGDVTLSGILSGIVDGLTKDGPNTLILSGVNTFTGAITVADGTMLVNGSTSAGAAVAVNNGATLGGNGTVSGAITLATGGTLAPGATTGVSIGTLNTAAVTLVASSTYSVDLNGATPTFDQVNSSGTVALASSSLSIASVVNGERAKVYTIISAVSVTGTFSGLADGATFNAHGRVFRINYTATQATLTDLAGTADAFLTMFVTH